MKELGITIMISSMLAICSTGIQAQEAIVATGGNATGSGGTVSYSVGQVSYTTVKSTSGTISQGVQQPYEILVITGIEDSKGINLEILAYPNPALDFLKLETADLSLENLVYQLYDINGSLIQNGKIVNRETIIQVRDLAPAAYYLKIVRDNTEVKTFKIIKN